MKETTKALPKTTKEKEGIQVILRGILLIMSYEVFDMQ